MPHKDPERASAYRKEYAKRNRARLNELARNSSEAPHRKAKKKEWEQANIERRQEYDRAHRAKKYAMVMARRSEGCADCGEKDFRVIQLHAPEGHSTHRKCIGDGSRFGFAALEAELAICVPLCANCHVRRHAA